MEFLIGGNDSFIKEAFLSPQALFPDEDQEKFIYLPESFFETVEFSKLKNRNHAVVFSPSSDGGMLKCNITYKTENDDIEIHKEDQCVARLFNRGIGRRRTSFLKDGYTIIDQHGFCAGKFANETQEKAIPSSGYNPFAECKQNNGITPSVDPATRNYSK